MVNISNYSYQYYKVQIVYLSVCLCNCNSRLKLDPQIHIYLESVSPGECYKHVYITTTLFVLKKKPKMVLLPEKGMELQA